MKKIVIMSAIEVFLVTVCGITELAKINIYEDQEVITGAEPLSNVPGYPLNSGFITQSPGIMVGTTWYDYQSNGSTGNRIAVCNDGTIYVSWMNALEWPPPPRHIYHNYHENNGNWHWDMGCQVDVLEDPQAMAGYTIIDVYKGYRGAIVYHYISSSIVVRLAVDNGDYPGWGYFERFNVPNSYEDGLFMWPYITIDRNFRIHIVMTERTFSFEQRVIYVRSADGGQAWTPVEVVDTLVTLSSVIDASPVSDKVVIAYTHPTTYLSQRENDIVYIISEDGANWDFQYGKINVTNYLYDDDSLWAFTDMDAIFDYNDNFHLIWNANTIDSDYQIQWNTRLFHYNGATREINLIYMWPEENNWIADCAPGDWNLPICKMNMGVQEEGNILFAIWTQFDTTDCSQNGYANGEIYISYTGNGTDWEEPLNLTKSHTPDCEPGECDNDHWSSLADVVDDSLYIVYINDKDAGSIPPGEGVATENPVMYLAVPVDTIVGIDDKIIKPDNFRLYQNYPNPFNATTTIRYNLPGASDITIEIFDLLGRKVETLVQGEQQAGYHQVVWDAEGKSSGMYFYRIQAGDFIETRKMVVLK